MSALGIVAEIESRETLENEVFFIMMRFGRAVNNLSIATLRYDKTNRFGCVLRFEEYEVDNG